MLQFLDILFLLILNESEGFEFDSLSKFKIKFPIYSNVENLKCIELIIGKIFYNVSLKYLDDIPGIFNQYCSFVEYINDLFITTIDTSNGYYYCVLIIDYKNNSLQLKKVTQTNISTIKFKDPSLAKTIISYYKMRRC